MAKRWSFKEDYIVCKYSYEHRWKDLSSEELNFLMLKLKEDGFQMQYLSVGMSADYKIAINNGSNMIRLGSTIFGKRNYEVN